MHFPAIYLAFQIASQPSIGTVEDTLPVTSANNRVRSAPSPSEFALKNPAYRPFEITLVVWPVCIFHPELFDPDAEKVVTGINIGLGGSFAFGVWGVDIGLASGVESSSYGIQTAVWIADQGIAAGLIMPLGAGRIRNCYGVCVGGAIWGNHQKGLMASYAGTIYDHGRGIQISSAYNVTDSTFAGLQIAGAVNAVAWRKGSMSGLQIGVINIGGTINGGQIGVINIARNLTGFQVGAVNVASRGKLPFMVGFLAGAGGR